MADSSADSAGLGANLHKDDLDAADALMPLVYDELRRIAQSFLRREASGHTLQATAIVNEAYLRLADQRDAKWQNRSQFMSIAATMIRRILVDHARAKRSAKRGGGFARLTLHESVALSGERGEPYDLIDVHESLERLAQSHGRQARVVELRFFGGLGVDETAHVLDVSARTVKEDWRFARAWLRSDLGGEAA